MEISNYSGMLWIFQLTKSVFRFGYIARLSNKSKNGNFTNIVWNKINRFHSLKSRILGFSTVSAVFLTVIPQKWGWWYHQFCTYGQPYVPGKLSQLIQRPHSFFGTVEGPQMSLIEMHAYPLPGPPASPQDGPSEPEASQMNAHAKPDAFGLGAVHEYPFSHVFR